MIRVIAFGTAKQVVELIGDALLSNEERTYVFACIRDHWCIHCGAVLTVDRPRCHCRNDD
jgi:hypothetical protein